MLIIKCVYKGKARSQEGPADPVLLLELSQRQGDAAWVILLPARLTFKLKTPDASQVQGPAACLAGCSVVMRESVVPCGQGDGGTVLGAACFGPATASGRLLCSGGMGLGPGASSLVPANAQNYVQGAGGC